MNKEVYMVRHGKVRYPLNKQGQELVYPPETPLSTDGILQIEKVSDWLRREGVKLEVLFSSPFTRTRQSAEILRSGLQVIPEVIIIEDLMDVFPCSWYGVTMAELEKIGGDVYSNPRSSEQETLEHLLMRARRGIESVMRTGGFRSIGIVSHGDLLSGIDWVLRTPDEQATYLEMQNRFYLQRGEVAKYVLNSEMKMVEGVRILEIN